MIGWMNYRFETLMMLTPLIACGCVGDAGDPGENGAGDADAGDPADTDSGSGDDSDAGTTPLTFPDETTTGWNPEGTSAMSGDLTLATPGATFEDIDLDGCLTITAANVTVRNVRIRCSKADWAGIAINGSATGILIEDVEVDGEAVSLYGIRAERPSTLRRVAVHGARNGMYVNETGVLIEDSYVYDLAACPATPACGSDQPIEVTLSAADPGTVVLRHNRFVSALNSGPAVALHSFDQAVTLETSLLDGGSYCLQFYDTSITIRDNHFDSTTYDTCGKYGPVQTNDEASATWTGNVWHESGEALAAP